MAGAGPITGGCQCGAVRYRLNRPPSKVSVCFCRMCQKAVGGYFGAYASSTVADVIWTKGQPSLFASSKAAERGFCPACGTPLTFAYRGKPGLSVAAGTLDDPEAFPPTIAYGGRGPPGLVRRALPSWRERAPRTTSQPPNCRSIARGSTPTAIDGRIR